MATPPDIRPLQEQHLEKVLRMRHLAFGDSSASLSQQLEEFKVRMQYFLAYFVEDEPASLLAAYPFGAYYAGHPIRISALGSVLTAPEYRRRGHVRALLANMLASNARNGFAWSLEYPFDPAYYARYGWQSIPNGQSLEVPVQHFFRKAHVEAKELGVNTLAPIKPIYATWASHYNFALTRDDVARESWQRLIQNIHSPNPKRIYLLQDAYCILSLPYENNERKLVIHDYAYSSAAGKQHLLDFWGGFSGQVASVRFTVAPDDPMGFDYARYMLKGKSELQARIISVNNALNNVVTPHETTFVLSVTDDFCAWNQQHFLITCKNGRCGVSTTQEPADVHCDIRALTLLLSGSINTRNAQKLELFKGDAAFVEVLVSFAGERVPFMAPADGF